MTTHTSPAPIRIGISSCLLGEPVRYDGNHKRDPFITEVLARYFEFVPVCPEVGIGLGVPRPPIRLVDTPDHPRAVGVRDPALDVSDRLRVFGRRTATALSDLSGYLFKARSPSCGLDRVPVYRTTGGVAGRGTGLYARQIVKRHPLLPVEEEGRLNDPALRENFIERVFAYHRWRTLCAARLTPRALVAFHAAHKLTLMSHGTEHYRTLGRLVADAGARSMQGLAAEYATGFMGALRHLATRRRHTNVLQHLSGYLKRVLDRDDRAELQETIEAYRTGLLPLVVPITLFKHHFRRQPDPYIAQQVYLHPYPEELMLRNHV
ncbi:MAG: hypothetical protein B7Z66_12890 [Chromatiales bacterium 21-64-14]|nr:MAG: hypothetical protein B7Z66_12890 [Chromatiales bacterium 21-64-14]HQU16357.1 DUF523 and DUF1722 domain-containing protein [Gammaproteobacteria bacterium]